MGCARWLPSFPSCDGGCRAAYCCGGAIRCGLPRCASVLRTRVAPAHTPDGVPSRAVELIEQQRCCLAAVCPVSDVHLVGSGLVQLLSCAGFCAPRLGELPHSRTVATQERRSDASALLLDPSGALARRVTVFLSRQGGVLCGCGVAAPRGRWVCGFGSRCLWALGEPVGCRLVCVLAG